VEEIDEGAITKLLNEAVTIDQRWQDIKKG